MLSFCLVQVAERVFMAKSVFELKPFVWIVKIKLLKPRVCLCLYLSLSQASGWLVSLQAGAAEPSRRRKAQGSSGGSGETPGHAGNGQWEDVSQPPLHKIALWCRFTVAPACFLRQVQEPHNSCTTVCMDLKLHRAKYMPNETKQKS